MNEPIKICLHDNSRIVFSWVKPGMLRVELLQPLTKRDGHGWWVVGAAQLTGEELEQFLDDLTTEPKEAA